MSKECIHFFGPLCIMGAFVRYNDGGKAALGYGYIVVRNDTTQQSGQTADQQV